MGENQIQTILDANGLEVKRATEIFRQFEGYFAIAEEWEAKAKRIVVTDASQVEEMKMARVARLFLREKRLAIEASRKSLKEQALREGKAIDGIANLLKALIIPTEKYLETQERFVELKAEAEVEVRRVAFEKSERDRVAKEEEDKRIEADKIKSELNRIRIESENRLIEIARGRDEAALKERLAKRTLAKQTERSNAEADKLKAERDKIEADKKVAEEGQQTAQRQLNIVENIAADAGREIERQQKELAIVYLMECPSCGHKFKPEARG